MAPDTPTIVGIGEVLWDLLPDGKQIGGAPANFAYIATLLGNHGVIASRVGTDELGRELRARLERLGLETSFLQSDMRHATGTSDVCLDADGQPHFEIASPVAWDFFDLTPNWRELASQADAVCFGTLAQRSESSREATRQFLRRVRPGTLRIFDANLREPHCSADVVLESLREADLVKLNDGELDRVTEWLGLSPGGQESRAAELRRVFDLKLVCVTRGPRGSLLIAENERDEHAGFTVCVRDTVGAGDAFTAALAHHSLRCSGLRRMNEAANRAGAWVASRAGATPPAEPKQIGPIR